MKNFTADKITFNDAVKIIESELAIREERINASKYKRAKMQQLIRRRRFLNKLNKRGPNVRGTDP